MATIKDVAERSGVSKATVSYILNNRPIPIGVETRERVLAAMRDLNYRPVSARQSSSAKRTNTVGVIFPSFGGRLVDLPYYNYLIDGILFVAIQSKWNTLLFNCETWEDAHQSLRSYCDGSCAGLILIGPSPMGDLVVALKERGIPFILINTGTQQSDISSVDIDNEAAAVQAVRYLIDEGHRRIAMLPGAAGHDSTQLRVRGFRRALTEAGLKYREEWVMPGEYSEESGYQRTHLLLQAESHPSKRPTALFCGNDLVAQGAYQALAERNISVPDDMSVIGMDDQLFARTMNPPLTSIRQPLQEIGERALTILMAQIDQGAVKDRTVRKVLLPVELVRRRSVAPPQASAQNTDGE
ncbi:HTH-type transcriptional repressor PurR [Capsulimonas corticalis]|uniref:HTH-type transcriptional repressor PurR n=1 Tax=Capsulimonas corticalis TaxID=2219043 RepID=A0A9N7L7Q7_9BACT|nr:LacI family DNA-binding transcriptional regulator [Capsulimonas corticalis]BDI32522.1 HTH-type transcriptional repressor PurR [Capsulimonas corticalis]